MRLRRGVITSAGMIAMLTVTSASSLELDKSLRICVVAVQDRSKQGVSFADVNAMLASMLVSEGLQAVPLAFQPLADVEYAAQKANCDYILYTDIVGIRETVRSQFMRALQRFSGSRADDVRTIAEIEFRLFSLDEVLPRLSTALTASDKRAGPAPSSIAVWSGFRSAVGAALAQEAGMVRAEARANTVRSAEK
jgi:hypothetical protein